MVDSLNGSQQNGAGFQPEVEANAELWQRLYVLRRRWPLVIGGGLITLAAALWFAAKQEPEYRADAVVQRHDDRSELTGGAGLGAPNLVSELEILRSEAVLRNVVDSLGLRVSASAEASMAPGMLEARTGPSAEAGEYRLVPKGDTLLLEAARTGVIARSTNGTLAGRGLTVRVDSPAVLRDPVDLRVVTSDDAVGALQRTISIGQIPNTNLIRIEYRGQDPQRTAGVVNGVVRAYQSFSARKARSDARRRREILQEQLAQIADSLTAARQVLSDYQTRSGSLNPATEGGAIAALRMQVEDEVRALEFEESTLLSLQSALNQQNPPDDVFRRVVIGAQDLIPTGSELYARMQQYETERSQLTTSRSGLTREATRVQVLDSLIAATKRDMRSATDQSLAALRGRLRAAEGRLAELNMQLTRYPEQASAFSGLEQRVAAVQGTYDLLAAKYYEAQIAEQVETGMVEVVDSATVPLQAEPTNGSRLALLAFVLGCLLGASLAFLLEYMNRKVRTPADVERASRLQLLAGIPFLSGVGDVRGSSLVMTKADGTIGAEAFRMLRTAVQYAKAERPKVIAVTSSGPGEGKSLISANFAIAMAKQGMNVLLVDADLRRPTIHKLFDIPHVPGLSDLLGGESVTPLRPEQVEATSLKVLPCGTHAPNPAELLGSPGFARMMEKLRAAYDLVVIDTPPLLAVADATALLPFVDGTLIVARSERTDRFALGHAVALLRRTNSHVLGVVLNGIRKETGIYSPSGSGYYGYAYTEYYRNEEPKTEVAPRTLLDRLLRRERF